MKLFIDRNFYKTIKTNLLIKLALNCWRKTDEVYSMLRLTINQITKETASSVTI